MHALSIPLIVLTHWIAGLANLDGRSSMTIIFLFRTLNWSGRPYVRPRFTNVTKSYWSNTYRCNDKLEFSAIYFERKLPSLSLMETAGYGSVSIHKSWMRTHNMFVLRSPQFSYRSRMCPSQNIYKYYSITIILFGDSLYRECWTHAVLTLAGMISCFFLYLITFIYENIDKLFRIYQTIYWAAKINLG